MEETVLVIMLKDSNTGLFQKELGTYKIDDTELIYNIFAFEKEEKYYVNLKLTTDKELNDWEYEAVFDYYDEETILPYVTSIKEDVNCYNPAWDIELDFFENTEEMEKKINCLLKLHKTELQSVYEAIADKRDDYINNEK